MSSRCDHCGKLISCDRDICESCIKKVLNKKEDKITWKKKARKK